MPLFCFQSTFNFPYYKKEFVPVGIKVKLQNNVNTFYNIGSEKNWIRSVVNNNIYNGINTMWVKVRKIDDKCQKYLAGNSKREKGIKPEKVPHFQKCKRILKKCFIKLATKSETLQKCDNFVEKCQMKMGQKFENVRKIVLDEFSRFKICFFDNGKDQRSNNSLRVSQYHFSLPTLIMLSKIIAK